MAAGLFDKADFRYIASKDEYQCPAGKRAIWRYTTVEGGLTIHKYWTSACFRCAIKAQCTTNQYRHITRWEHEDVLEAMQKRLDRTPKASRIRRQTVEHPFGTLKAWMGAGRLLRVLRETFSIKPNSRPTATVRPSQASKSPRGRDQRFLQPRFCVFTRPRPVAVSEDRRLSGIRLIVADVNPQMRAWRISSGSKVHR
jgi:hypothetical protein